MAIKNLNEILTLPIQLKTTEKRWAIHTHTKKTQK